jgi:hypothetical protein
VDPTRLQKERKAKEELAEKHINRSWGKELKRAEIYCQRQEKMERTPRKPMLLMERWTLYIYYLICGFLLHPALHPSSSNKSQ